MGRVLVLHKCHKWPDLRWWGWGAGASPGIALLNPHPTSSPGHLRASFPPTRGQRGDTPTPTLGSLPQARASPGQGMSLGQGTPPQGKGYQSIPRGRRQPQEPPRGLVVVRVTMTGHGPVATLAKEGMGQSP